MDRLIKEYTWDKRAIMTCVRDHSLGINAVGAFVDDLKDHQERESY